MSHSLHPIRAAGPRTADRRVLARGVHATTLRPPRAAGARPPGTTPNGAGRGWSNRAGGPGTRRGRGSPPRPPRLRGRPRPARRRPVPRGRSRRSSVGGARCAAVRPGHGPRPRWPSADRLARAGQRPPAVPQGGFAGARQVDRTTSGASYSPARSAANPRAAAAGPESSTPATTGSSGPRPHDVSLPDDDHRAVRVGAHRAGHGTPAGSRAALPDHGRPGPAAVPRRRLRPAPRTGRRRPAPRSPRARGPGPAPGPLPRLRSWPPRTPGRPPGAGALPPLRRGNPG